MSLLTVANLVFGYGERIILDGVNISVAAGEHVGLVGRNGCGKSTLLRLVAGLEKQEPEAGQIQLARGTIAGYLHQDPNLDVDKTLLEEARTAFETLDQLHDDLGDVAEQMASAQGDELEVLLKRYERIEHRIESMGGYAVDHRVEEILMGLGIEKQTFDVKVRDLSGGQRGRLALAKLLLSGPDILLLDEPTNHLDIAGRQWLEQFLGGYEGAVILISHDRWMLDRVVTKIYELERGRMVEFPGNYQQYREQREQRTITQARAYEKQQTKIKQEQSFIDRYRAGQRSRQAQGRERRLERYKDAELLEKPVELKSMSLTFAPNRRSGDIVLRTKNLGMTYDDKPLFRGVEIEVNRGECIGVIGPNGAGKSTLIRCLLEEQQPTEGTASLGASVDVGHFRQTHDHLNLSETVIEYLRRFTPNDLEQEARDLAGAFLFSGDSQDKPLSVLSGGERGRAVLAGLMTGGHNLLVLDEPSNHLDIPSAERLEEALHTYAKEEQGYSTVEKKTGNGTLLLITHDRMLLDRVVDRLLILDGRGGWSLFQGTYSEYAASLEAAPLLDTGEQTRKNKPKSKPEASQPQANNTESKKPGKQSKPRGKSRGGVTKLSQKALEEKIETLETRIAELDQQLADPDLYRDASAFSKVHDDRMKLATELEPLEAEWMERAESTA
ncbi:ribosomal protection-like ABC-F family protein [Mucisphaera calidilacus]|uniref:Putative ABC transporter ATP-binding protein YjjK n=1 Tax=Mucisphaera calidilacus TaxID=2527982 RepID=A0A518BVX8_9BACT|nr:ABC-F family ATP-binding cassette domain-containing protein [Mucisphaera calidilacus]QDU71132.1 putative ABC transporter ATP-binding protein YjjK [Mucisphaera calidilacus]